jgi:hypothetical protein
MKESARRLILWKQEKCLYGLKPQVYERSGIEVRISKKTDCHIYLFILAEYTITGFLKLWYT